jgi:hypothetical protein
VTKPSGATGALFRYVPVHQLGGEAHVVVDGARHPGTVYSLSHWPGTPTPPELRADLSAEIVRRALHDRTLLPAEVEVATIDHYDIDGCIALGLVVLDGLDQEFGPLMVEAARVGDFDVVTDRRAALIAFALNQLETRALEPGAGPPGPERRDVLELCGVLAHEALGLLYDLAADVERFEPLWHDEGAAYDASVRALTEGWASIEEIPESDLAVVRVDPDHEDAPSARWDSAPLHRAAVHSATSCLRVATVAGQRMELRYRYETWVRLARRRPRPRVDLARLAATLDTVEKTAGGSGRWVFDGAGAITGALHLVAEDSVSTIEPERFIETLRQELAILDKGPPAWDAYRPVPGSA